MPTLEGTTIYFHVVLKNGGSANLPKLKCACIANTDIMLRPT